MSTATVPLRQQITPADREVALAVINRVLPTYAAGLHAPTTSLSDLAHEAERLEAMPKSPVVKSMRAMVDSERAWRRHLARMGGRG
jgi:hypothetical protein